MYLFTHVCAAAGLCVTIIWAVRRLCIYSLFGLCEIMKHATGRTRRRTATCNWKIPKKNCHTQLEEPDEELPHTTGRTWRRTETRNCKKPKKNCNWKNSKKNCNCKNPKKNCNRQLEPEKELQHTGGSFFYTPLTLVLKVGVSLTLLSC